jgi:hypothetical protein
MRFLERINPRATRRGLIVWSIIGGIVGFAVGLYGSYRPLFAGLAGYIFIAWMTLSVAVAFGAIYWQSPDETEDA